MLSSLIYFFIFFNVGQCAVKYGGNDHRYLSHCLTTLMQRFQKYEGTKTAVLMNVDDNTAKEMHEIGKFSYLSRSPPWFHDTIPTDSYIIMNKNVEELEENLENLRKDYYWQPKKKFVIAMEDFDYEKVATLLKFYYVYDVMVLAKTNGSNYDVFAFGSDLDSCNRPKNLVKLCNCTHLRVRIHKLATINKFDGCHIKMVALEREPFFYYDNKTIGLDQYMLQLLEEVQNITVEIEYYGKEYEYFNLLENFTYKGAMKDMERDDVDGLVGACFLTLPRARALEYSPPHLVGHLRLIIPRSYYLTTWNAVLRLTVRILVAAVVFYGFVSIITLKFTIIEKRTRDAVRDLLTVYGFFLNNININSNIISKGISQRIFIMCVLVFSIFTTTLIQATVNSTMTSPVQEKQDDTVKVVLDNYRMVSLRNYAEPGSIVCKIYSDCLQKIARAGSKKLFMFTSDFEYKFLQYELDINERLNVFKVTDPHVWLLFTVFFRRGSVIPEVFNKYLGRMSNAGLITQHLKRLLHAKELHYSKKYAHNVIYGTMFDMGELGNIFYVLVCGYIAAAAVFIAEVFYKKCIQ